MKNWQAILIVATLLLAAILNGGIYKIVAVPGGRNKDGAAYVINKWTGRTWHFNGDGYTDTGKWTP